MDMIVEVEVADAAAFEALPAGSLNKISSRNFIGGQEIATLLITLTPILAPLVKDIIVKLIESGKGVTFKGGGIEVSGISEATLPLVLEAINRADGKPPR